jgi:hypothetical protein
MSLRSVTSAFGRACRGTLLVVGALVVLSAFAPVALARLDTTPEIDPASATSALTLLAGGFLMLTSRIRRR